MKKKLICFVIAGSLMQCSFATSLFPFFEKQKKHAWVSKSDNKMHADAKYTDLSGTWRGICTMNGSTQEMQTIIKNDKDYIQLDEQGFIIDNVQTTSDFDKFGGRFGHIRFHWDEKSALIADIVDLDFDYTYDSDLKESVVRLSLALENDKLVMKTIEKKVIGAPSDDQYTQECVFEKVIK
ncbi:MAG: hypothetical protein H2069_04825 [Legionella sp.]|nr:hypothetical protein [Legionella sp.]